MDETTEERPDTQVGWKLLDFAIRTVLWDELMTVEQIEGLLHIHKILRKDEERRKREQGESW